jgi:hypothetical protein
VTKILRPASTLTIPAVRKDPEVKICPDPLLAAEAARKTETKDRIMGVRGTSIHPPEYPALVMIL